MARADEREAGTGRQAVIILPSRNGILVHVHYLHQYPIGPLREVSRCWCGVAQRVPGVAALSRMLWYPSALSPRRVSRPLPLRPAVNTTFFLVGWVHLPPSHRAHQICAGSCHRRPQLRAAQHHGITGAVHAVDGTDDQVRFVPAAACSGCVSCLAP